MVVDSGCVFVGQEVLEEIARRLGGYTWMVVAVEVSIGYIVVGWVALPPLFCSVFRVSFGARGDVSSVAEDGDSGALL